MNARARTRRARVARAALLWCCFALETHAERAPSSSSLGVDAHAKTSLVWILGDDDIFGAPDSSPPSPATSIGDRDGYDGLFEGSSSRYTGRENRLELRLAGEATGFHPSLETRAGLLLGIDATGLAERDGTLRFEDAGSWVEAFVRFSRTPQRAADGAGVRLYPLDGDRERLGALEALGVGGAVGPWNESPYARAAGPVRAGKLWLELGGVRGFVVLKTAPFLEPLPSAPAAPETSYALFGGVESHWRRSVSFGLGFGYFEHGRLANSAAFAPRATTLAASARLALGSGIRTPRAPASFGSEPPPFDPPYPDGERVDGFALGVEGAHIAQRLVVFERQSETALAGSRAFAALGTFRRSPVELRAAFIARDAGFVVRNVPGVFPGQTTPAAASELPELTGLASARFELSAPLALTLALGLRRPAAILTPALDRLGQPTGTTLVLGDPFEAELLPPGQAPVPVFDARPSAELRVSRLLEFLLWLGYRRDFNQTRLVPTGSGELTRGFADPDRIGYGVAARAVW